MSSLRFFIPFLFLVSFSEIKAQDLLKFTADKYTSNFETKVTTAEGNVKATIGEKKISGDKIRFLGMKGELEAEGNVVFEYRDLKIQGSEAKLNLNSGLGFFRNFDLKVGEQARLMGQRLERYGETQYRAQGTTITHCQDCPPAWSVFGSEFDVEIEEYAKIHHALFQVKDQPVAYVPFIILPLKNKRQSGFLFPRFTYNTDIGTRVSVPYFWAISQDSDFTFQSEHMNKGGLGATAEYRYMYSDGSFFEGQTLLVRNQSVDDVPRGRFAYTVKERKQLGANGVQRYEGELASDRLMSEHFPTQFKGALLPTLANRMGLGYQTHHVTSSFDVVLHQDNLARATDIDLNRNEHKSIHKLPEVDLQVPSFALAGPLRIQNHWRVTKFSRGTEEVDTQTQWIRTGERATFELGLSAPQSFYFVEWVPSVKTRNDFYHFYNSKSSPSAFRSRLLMEQSLQIPAWRVFQFENDFRGVKAVKNTVTPTIKWSFVPPEAKSRHRFFEEGGVGVSAPRFDLFDPNSESKVINVAQSAVSEEQKLKPHHLMTWGFHQRLTGRRGVENNRTYEDFLISFIEQDYSIKENMTSLLRLGLQAKFENYKASTNVAYDERKRQADRSNMVGFELWKLNAEITQNIGRINGKSENYVGNFSFGKIYSWTLTAGGQYDALAPMAQDKRSPWVRRNVNFLYQSPSKCWLFEVGFTRTAKDEADNNPWEWEPGLKLVFMEGDGNFF